MTKKQSLSELTDQAISLMKQMRTLDKSTAEYTEIESQWVAVQKLIAQAGNHSESRASARARAAR